jgi:excisionase family DNA binding protein
MSRKTKDDKRGASPFVTVKEFAAHFGIHERTVWRMIAGNKIKIVRLGRLVRIPRSEVDRLEKD